MGYQLNTRRYVQIMLIIILCFITGATVNWAAWCTTAIFFGLTLLCDFMFLDDSDYLYDPDYKNWSRKTAPDY